MSSQDQTTNADVVLSADVDQYNQSVGQAAQQTSVLANAVDALSARLDNLQQRSGKKLMLFGAGLGAPFVAAGAQSAVFEKQLSGLNATATVTGQNFDKLKGSVQSLTERFPVTRDQAIALVGTIENLGVTSEKSVDKLATTFTKLSGATGESMTQLADGMVELGRSMGSLDSGSMDRYANSLLTVSKNAGVSATGVLSFAQSVAPAARAAGIGEAATLGISAAFQKAGQSGYYAANAFSSMLNDINQLIATGSPEISKYANLIGKTSDQFKAMFASGQGSEAITQVFEAIQKQGQGAVVTLDRLGFDGVRAVQSFQALAQSGGLRKAIAEATGAMGDTNNLDKGSQAGFDGLLETLQQIRSTAADMGETVMDKPVKAMNMLAQAFNSVLHVGGQLVNLWAPLGASVGMLATGGVLFAGSMLAKVATVGAIARSTPVKAYREGTEAGQAIYRAKITGGEEAEMAAREKYLARQDEMNYLGRQFYGYGLDGGFNGMEHPRRSIGSWVAGGMKAFRENFVDTTTEFYKKSGRYNPYDDELSPSARFFNAVRHPRSFAAGIMATVDESGGKVKPVPSSAFGDAEALGKAVKQNISQTLSAAAAAGTAGKELNSLSVEAGALTRAFVRLSVSQAGAGARTIGAGVAKVGGAIGSAMLSNPISMGILAASIGIPMYQSFQDRRKESLDFSNPSDLPINAYNTALGMATTTVSDFTMAVKSATEQLPAVDKMADAMTLSPQVKALAATSGRKLTNAGVTSFRSIAEQVAYLQTLGITDPRQLQLASADLLQANNQDAGKTQKVLDAYRAAGSTPDFGTIFASVDKKQLRGFMNGQFALRGSKEAAAQIRQAFGYITQARGRDGVYGTDYQQQKTADNLRAYFGQLLDPKRLEDGGKGAQTAVQGVSVFEQQLFGGKQIGFNPAAFGQSMEMALGKNAKNAAARGKYFEDQLLHSSDKGIRDQAKALFGSANTGGIPGAMLHALMSTDTSGLYSRVRAQGGRLAGGVIDSSTAAEAIAHPEDVNKNYQAVDEMLANAKKMGMSLTDVTANLQRMQDTVNDSTNGLSQFAELAKSIVGQQQAASLTYMGRFERAGVATTALRNAEGADRTGKDYGKNLKQAQAGQEAAKNDMYSYLQQLVAANRNFEIQSQRAAEDYNLTVFRANRDFHTSMLHAEDDYHHSMSIRTRDFNKSMTRMAEDAAKSMYNPYQRVFGRATADVGTLTYNLEDQNRRMQQQVKQLAQIRKMGVSSDAIRQLDLANPENAQELNRLIYDLGNDPKQAARINALVATRMKASKALATSQYNTSFKRAQEDFAQGTKDAEYAYDLMVKRAGEAQTRSMDDMAANYKTSMTRAAQDLSRFGEEITGNFGDVFDTAIQKLAKNLGPLGDAMINALNKFKQQFPEYWDNTFGITLGTPGSANAAERAMNLSVSAAPSMPVGGAGGSHQAVIQQNFNGAINVQAQDPTEMTRKIAQKQRLNNLSGWPAGY